MDITARRLLKGKVNLSLVVYAPVHDTIYDTMGRMNDPADIAYYCKLIAVWAKPRHATIVCATYATVKPELVETKGAARMLTFMGWDAGSITVDDATNKAVFEPRSRKFNDLGFSVGYSLQTHHVREVHRAAAYKLLNIIGNLNYYHTTYVYPDGLDLVVPEGVELYGTDGMSDTKGY